jgi:hypothetical protein
VSAAFAGPPALVRGRPPLPSLEPVEKALLGFRESMDRLRQSGALPDLNIDEVERVFSFAFAVQQLRGDLGDLEDRIAEHAKSSSTDQSR